MPKVRVLRQRATRVLIIAVVLSCTFPLLAAIIPGVTTALPSASAAVGGSRSASGYWLVASDGGVFNYGDAAFYGSSGGVSLNKPIVAMAATPDGRGYWLVASDGGVFNYGDAAFYGSSGGVSLNKPIVAMAATPDGRGYWLVASDGGVFNYGDAAFYGSSGGVSLNKPIVAMAATPDGRGYWLVASDGGVFNYGDAAFYGSSGGVSLNKPIVAMAATPDGRGYWLVASDGGVFNYGDAAFYGSSGGVSLNKPIVAMAATPDGRGYWLVASDGGVFNYGDAAFYGSSGGVSLNKLIVAMAAPPAKAAGAPVPTEVSPNTATTTATTETTPLPSGGMPAPAGYTAQQLIFDDQFSGSGLDTTKWSTYLGAQGIVWNNFGSLPQPYSGPNVPGAGTDLEMYAPSQVRVNNGLALTAQRNTNQYSHTYPWLSGVVTTEGKFSLPTTGWYVQARVKDPDMTRGLWPNMWFLPSGPGPFNEIDFMQGGFYGGPSNVNYAPVGAGYFDNAGSDIDESIPNVGFDASAGYHTYGVQWTPGVGIDGYVDGKLVWSVTQSQVPGGIVAQAYEIILNLQVAADADAGWRTITNPSSPGGSMDVAEVQAYS